MEVTANMTGEKPMPDGSSIPPSEKTHTFKVCMIIDMAGFGIMPS